MSHRRASPQPPVKPKPVWITQYRALLAAEGLAMAAFATSMPIIPLYIQELGVRGSAEVAWWAGLIQSAAAIALAVFAPIWGFLSDRLGKRTMLLRAMVGGIAVVGLMSLITNPWQLLILRILQGCLTGTVTAATVLLAAIAPREAAGRTQGTLTTVIFVGNSVGPLAGGVVADLLGLRFTFLATALLLVAATAILLRWVREPGSEPAGAGLTAGARVSSSDHPSAGAHPPAGPKKRPVFDFSPFREMPSLAGILLIGLAVQTAGSIVYPMLPLYVQSLDAHGGMVASATGLILGASALCAALAAMLAGRLGEKMGYGLILQVCLLGGFLFSLPQAWVGNPWQLLVLRSAASAFLGGTMPALNALVATRVSRNKQGGVFGLASSFNSVGNAIGPAVGSAVATAFGLPSVFIAAALALALTAIATSTGIRHFRRPGPGNPETDQERAGLLPPIGNGEND